MSFGRPKVNKKSFRSPVATSGIRRHREWQTKTKSQKSTCGVDWFVYLFNTSSVMMSRGTWDGWDRCRPRSMSDSESTYGGDLGSQSEGDELSEWKRERLKDATQSPIDGRWYIRYYFSASRRATVKICRAAGSSETKHQARAVWARLEPELQRPPVGQVGGSRSRSPSPTGSL